MSKRAEFAPRGNNTLGELARQAAPAPRVTKADALIGSDEADEGPPVAPIPVRRLPPLAKDPEKPPPKEPRPPPPKAKQPLTKDEEAAQEQRSARRTTGTFTEPYVKKDGAQTQKWAITAPLGFVKEVQQFVANHLPLGVTASEWAVEMLRQEMSRAREEKADDGKSKKG